MATAAGQWTNSGPCINQKVVPEMSAAARMFQVLARAPNRTPLNMSSSIGGARSTAEMIQAQRAEFEEPASWVMRSGGSARLTTSAMRGRTNMASAAPPRTALTTCCGLLRVSPRIPPKAAAPSRLLHLLSTSSKPMPPATRLPGKATGTSPLSAWIRSPWLPPFAALAAAMTPTMDQTSTCAPRYATSAVTMSRRRRRSGCGEGTLDASNASAEGAEVSLQKRPSTMAAP